MKVITEMRNAIEHGDVKQLTGLESDTVRGAWSIVEGWAIEQKVDLGG